MLDPTVLAAVLASAIAAGATVAGYLLTQSRARRERKATAFAEALVALRRYQDFPFQIWRRADDTAETRNRIMDEQTTSGMEVNVQRYWLQVDAPVVGEAFLSLADACSEERRTNYRLAWQHPPITDSTRLAEVPPFVRHTADPELALCIAAMRNELSLLAPLRRPAIRRRIRAQAQARRAQALSTTPAPVPAPAP